MKLPSITYVDTEHSQYCVPRDIFPMSYLTHARHLLAEIVYLRKSSFFRAFEHEASQVSAVEVIVQSPAYVRNNISLL